MTNDSVAALAGPQVALTPKTQPLTTERIQTLEPLVTSLALNAGLDPEHWLLSFVEELLNRARTSGTISFESVERLLQNRKDDFLRDFLTARRMYRTYPRLFPEFANSTAKQQCHKAGMT